MSKLSLNQETIQKLNSDVKFDNTKTFVVCTVGTNCQGSFEVCCSVTIAKK